MIIIAKKMKDIFYETPNKIPLSDPTRSVFTLNLLKGISPKYELVQNIPPFKYHVTVGKLEVTGEEKSKKKAKNNAAKAMLDKLNFERENGQKEIIGWKLILIVGNDTKTIRLPIEKKKAKEKTQ